MGGNGSQQSRILARFMRRVRSASVLVGVVGLGVGLLPGAGTAAAVSAGQGVDMKVLVISADGQETDFPAITSRTGLNLIFTFSTRSACVGLRKVRPT